MAAARLSPEQPNSLPPLVGEGHALPVWTVTVAHSLEMHFKDHLDSHMDQINILAPSPITQLHPLLTAVSSPTTKRAWKLLVLYDDRLILVLYF